MRPTQSVGELYLMVADSLAPLPFNNNNNNKVSIPILIIFGLTQPEIESGTL